MPTPAVIRRSPFIPRTAQRPYSHVGNSTRAGLDRSGLTALRAMVVSIPSSLIIFISNSYYKNSNVLTDALKSHRILCHERNRALGITPNQSIP